MKKSMNFASKMFCIFYFDVRIEIINIDIKIFNNKTFNNETFKKINQLKIKNYIQ